MAAQTTALTEFSTIGDKRTYTTSGHTVSSSKVVVNKRKVPVGSQTMSEFTVEVVHSTTDADSLVLPQKVNFTVVCKFPITGQSTDRDAALLIIRDIIAGDEFSNSVSTGEFLA